MRVPDPDKVDALLDWMIDGARPSANARDIVTGICERLVDCGVPISRFVLFIYTLHPNLQGRRFRWIEGEGVDMFEAVLGTFSTEMYHSNPLPHVLERQESIRRYLEDPDCPTDYLIVNELREQGMSDYLAQPLIFITDETHACSWSTGAVGGFTKAELALLERIRKPLARLTETYMLRLNAATLLSTYVGRNSGGFILDGQVHRGDGEQINAVIVFVDIKNFTALSNQMDGPELVKLLNDAMDQIVPPVQESGGEILKFMGDGFFAIYPLAEESDVSAVGQKSIQALEKCRQQLAVHEAGKTIEFRSAAHVGEFYYGNIGGGDRLDFTAIGPDVNYTARLLSAAPDLGVDHVVSHQLASVLPGQCAPIGETTLKGFSDEHTVWQVVKGE